MPEISEKPTQDDALAALKLLKDLLGEFPFGRTMTACRARWRCRRRSRRCAAAHIRWCRCTSSTRLRQGSGKSYLLSTVSWIVTGQAMPVLGAGKSEEEMDKRLDAAVITGQPLICIDNVVGEIGGETICRLTEQWRPQVRILGQIARSSKSTPAASRSSPTATTSSWSATSAGGWCAAASMPRIERPELRQFKRNPMQEILADRGVYIAAALTICRAYAVAGRPGRLPQLASYGEWSDTVRSALVWLGEADPVKSQDKSHADDPEADAAADHAERVESRHSEPARRTLRRCAT